MTNPSHTQGKVIVKDIEGVYLAPTNPANARKLVNSGQAVIDTFNPFTIRLTKAVPSPNQEKRRFQMKMPNMHEYFSVPKPIYVQNISNPIGVLSLSFRRQNGEIIPASIPTGTRDPIILTDIVPFDDIKNSNDFLKYLRLGRMQLLTEEEYDAYYLRKQEETGISANDLMVKATQKASSFDRTERVLTEQEARRLTKEEIDSLDANVDALKAPEITPRVLSICQKLDPSNSSKITPREALEAFSVLSLTDVDYKYIMDHSFEKADKNNLVVKKWALVRFKNVAGGEKNLDNDIIPQTSVDAPVKRAYKKKEVVAA